MSFDSDMYLCWGSRRKWWSTQVKWAKSLDTVMYQLHHQQSEAVRWKYTLPLCDVQSLVTGGCSAVSDGFFSVKAPMHTFNSSINLTANGGLSCMQGEQGPHSAAKGRSWQWPTCWGRSHPRLCPFFPRERKSSGYAQKKKRCS